MSAVLRNPANPDTGSNTRQHSKEPDQFGGAEELLLALDTGRCQLVAALQLKGDRLQLCSVLTEKVAWLDITLMKANKFATYDALNGLPSRRLLLDRFIHAAVHANRYRQFLALLFFDVNYLKRINDEPGHNAGDQLCCGSSAHGCRTPSAAQAPRAVTEETNSSFS